jgi:5-methylcytosine-specific restriction enzyme A
MSLRPCPSPGCSALVPRGRCPRHAVQAEARLALSRANAEATRPAAHLRGYDHAWSAVRKQFLGTHPLCVVCAAPATEADHIVSIREAPELRLKWSNLRALCKPCHSRRTARDQGFGKARRVP